ncbi:hypothetical protein B7P43_G07086 [Cryptotermes secundus]|uniref:Endonuclease/exonuclease/phosphatase domain-containing protein n=1 Tax=Cryptotermes secundus TaxID=105785 RepID=A0A2J7PD58_9NEOP|nr:hypothetical protein B7P43_G07086 [Cryptotermes secundus]
MTSTERAVAYFEINGKAEGNKEFGVAFVIEREFKSAIIDFKPISERICTLRIRTKFFNMTLMNVHAPTEEKEEEVKDYFYQQMEETHDSVPSNGMKVILGDLNAKIGKEKEHRGVIGTESLHDTTNHNGIKLIDFAESKNFIISSTYFPHKNIHKRTWAAPDGVTFNQIDHVLIEKRFAMNILDNMEDNEDNEEENTDDGEEEEEEIIEPPTKEEVEEALKEQKLNKAPGGAIPYQQNY